MVIDQSNAPMTIPPIRSGEDLAGMDIDQSNAPIAIPLIRSGEDLDRPLSKHQKTDHLAIRPVKVAIPS